MKISEKLLNLIFPPKCVVCGELLDFDRKVPLCDICLCSWEKAKREKCEKCGKEQTKCLCDHRKGISGAICHLALYSNNEVSGSILFALKKSNYTALFGYIAHEMAENIRSSVNTHGAVVVNAPRNPKHINKFGYDHSEKLAKLIARELGLEYCGALKQRAGGKEQKMLDSKMRKLNAKKNISLKERSKSAVAGRNIILIDDIITTGATLVTCAELLKNHGANKVYAAVAFKDRPKRKTK